MRAQVIVRLKDGVLDPQGEAIENALRGLGFTGVARVRVAKLFEIELDEGDAARAQKALEEMADKLLANPVIERYRVDVTDGAKR